MFEIKSSLAELNKMLNKKVLFIIGLCWMKQKKQLIYKLNKY